MCLFVTDIINNDSYMIFNEKAKKHIENAFSVDDIKQGHLLKGVVSRKKQIVPLILDAID